MQCNSPSLHVPCTLSFQYRFKSNFILPYLGTLANVKGSFRRVFSNFPSLTMRPTSTKRHSRNAKYFLKRSRRLLSDVSLFSLKMLTVVLRSCSLLQYSSTLRWKTAETRSRVIFSWLIVCRERQVFSNFVCMLNVSSVDNLHEIRKALDASISCFPYSKILCG